MAVFLYTAYAADGQLASGELNAGDRSDAFRQLDRQRLQPVSLDERGKAKPIEDEKKLIADDAPPTTQRLRLKSREVALFTEELSELLRGGIQLEPALNIMSRRRELSNLKPVATGLRDRLRDGMSFSDALNQVSPSFGELYQSLAAAGEAGGGLGTILERQAGYLRSLETLKGRVLFALIYPSFLIASAAAVGVLFLVFLIPKLMDLLDTTGGSLPLGAQLVINAADFFKSFWWLFALAIGAAIGATWVWAKHRRESWDRFRLRLPLFGALLRGRFHVQFLETMTNLVGNGLPLVRALQLTEAATPNRHLRRKLKKVLAEVSDGTPLSNALERSSEFPSLLIDMIAVGEQTGDLKNSLARGAERFDREMSKQAEKLSAMIQPAVVVLMAGMVGIMAYLMVSAIFQTISGLNG